MDVVGEFNYEDKDDMIKIVTREVDKCDFFADSNFEDQYLVEIIQTLRPALINLSNKISVDQLEDWFEK